MKVVNKNKQNKSNKKFGVLIIAGLLLITMSPAFSQENLSYELRSGASFAANKLGDASLDAGINLEGNLLYKVMPHLSVYLGWGWNKFSAKQSFAGSDVEFEETGYPFGVMFIHPLNKEENVDGYLQYFVRLGGIYKHIEVENKQGDIIADSGHGLGWQIGTGLVFDLDKTWEIRPSVHYQSLHRDINISGTTTPVHLSYYSVNIAISRQF